jgi:hypothetical protein
MVSRIAPGTMLDIFVVVLENCKPYNKPQVIVRMANLSGSGHPSLHMRDMSVQKSSAVT